MYGRNNFAPFNYGGNGNNYVPPPVAYPQQPMQQQFYPQQVPVQQPIQQPQMVQQPQQAPIPNQTIQNSPLTSIQGLAWVNGEVGAQAYLMPPNTGILLMDSDNPNTFYIKQSDGSGKASMTSYTYTERIARPAPVQDNSNFVTKEEFEEFKASFRAKKKEPKKESGSEEEI